MSGMSVIRELFRPDRVRIYEMTTMRPRITLSSMHLWTRGWQTRALGTSPAIFLHSMYSVTVMLKRAR